jgi:hypothetical protein
MTPPTTGLRKYRRPCLRSPVLARRGMHWPGRQRRFILAKACGEMKMLQRKPASQDLDEELGFVHDSMTVAMGLWMACQTHPMPRDAH